MKPRRSGNAKKNFANETGRSGNETKRPGNETRRSGNETGGLGMRPGDLGMRLRKESAMLTFTYHGFYCERVSWFHHTNCLVLWKSKSKYETSYTVTFPSLKKERQGVYLVGTYWHSVGHLAPCEITCTVERLYHRLGKFRVTFFSCKKRSHI